MKLKSTGWLLLALMCGVSIAGVTALPGVTTALRGNPLDTAVPTNFGEWTQVTTDLEQKRMQAICFAGSHALLDRIYMQMVTRTYVNKAGYRVALSTAYLPSFLGASEAQRVEACYLLQSFTVNFAQGGSLLTLFGNIEVSRVATSMGARSEPVTYWRTIDCSHICRVHAALTGQIPDGLMFRMSSVDGDIKRAFAMQQKFAADMMAAVPSDTRRQLSGLTTPRAAT